MAELTRRDVILLVGAVGAGARLAGVELSGLDLSGPGASASVAYADPDGHCPVFAEVVFDGADVYPLRPQSLDYATEVLYTSESGLPPLVSGSWSHAVARFSDDELAEAYRLFSGNGKQAKYVWLNLGVESASGELVASAGGSAKMQPYSSQDWGEVCLAQVRRLARVSGSRAARSRLASGTWTPCAGSVSISMLVSA